MTDDFVDRGANTLGKASVVERTGVAVPLQTLFMANSIQFIRCNSRPDVRGDDVQNLSSELCEHETCLL